MRLHCFDAERKLSGDGAVQLSRDHQIHNHTFAVGKQRKARLFRVEIALCATQKLIAEQTVFCQGDYLLVVEWLLDEINRAMFSVESALDSTPWMRPFCTINMCVAMPSSGESSIWPAAK